MVKHCWHVWWRVCARTTRTRRCAPWSPSSGSRGPRSAPGSSAARSGWVSSVDTTLQSIMEAEWCVRVCLPLLPIVANFYLFSMFAPFFASNQDACHTHKKSFQVNMGIKNSSIFNHSPKHLCRRERQWEIGDEGLTAAALTFKMQPWQSKFDQI